MNRAGNAINHPETIGPDPHTPGSPLPRAEFVNSIGYLPDGTPMNAAGNALNHPETMQPDMHNPGSPCQPRSMPQRLDTWWMVLPWQQPATSPCRLPLWPPPLPLCLQPLQLHHPLHQHLWQLASQAQPQRLCMASSSATPCRRMPMRITSSSTMWVAWH